MYYYNDITFDEISKVLEISASRVSQIHSKALLKIKNNLENGEELLQFFLKSIDFLIKI